MKPYPTVPKRSVSKFSNPTDCELLTSHMLANYPSIRKKRCIKFEEANNESVLC